MPGHTWGLDPGWVWEPCPVTATAVPHCQLGQGQPPPYHEVVGHKSDEDPPHLYSGLPSRGRRPQWNTSRRLLMQPGSRTGQRTLGSSHARWWGVEGRLGRAEQGAGAPAQAPLPIRLTHKTQTQRLWKWSELQDSYVRALIPKPGAFWTPGSVWRTVWSWTHLAIPTLAVSWRRSPHHSD